MAALSDTKHQKLIGEDFLQQPSAIKDWVFHKKSTPIVWLTDSSGLPSFLHVKRLQEAMDTPRYDKKNIGSKGTDSQKAWEGSRNPKYKFYVKQFKLGRVWLR